MRWSSPTAAISGTDRLILSDPALEALPTEGQHAGLQVLDIAHNRLTEESSALSELRLLDLRDVASSPVREILALTAPPGVISLAGGLPAPELFDGPGLRDAFVAALAEAGRTLPYSTTEGYPALRELIAARLAARGLPTGADDVLVMSGSQQALTLVATVAIEPGDRVLVEEPAYLAAIQASSWAGAKVVAVPCDDDGGR